MARKINKYKERNLKSISTNTKWISYDEVLDFLEWQFDEDFADQQIQLFHIVRGRIYGSKTNKSKHR